MKKHLSLFWNKIKTILIHLFRLFKPLPVPELPPVEEKAEPEEIVRVEKAKPKEVVGMVDIRLSPNLVLMVMVGKGEHRQWVCGAH